MRTTKRKLPAGEPQYQATERERAAMTRYLDACANHAPKVKSAADANAVRLSPDHPEDLVGWALIMDAIGTTDFDFLDGILQQLAKLASVSGKPNDRDINFMLSVVKGIKPRDQTEAMLAAQMSAVHMASMKLADRLARAETIEQQDSAERAFNKLARTFTTQMEALKRYRTSSEQKVTVQQVNVSDSAQAIVGNVTQAAQAEKSNRPDPSPPLLSDARVSPMPPIEQSKEKIQAVQARRRKNGA
jgi:hypothetical protein